MNKKSVSIFQLVLGLTMIWLFVTQVGNVITTFSHEPVIKYAEDHEIDAGALFYTESDRGLEANYMMLKEDELHD